MKTDEDLTWVCKCGYPNHPIHKIIKKGETLIILKYCQLCGKKRK